MTSGVTKGHVNVDEALPIDTEIWAKIENSETPEAAWTHIGNLISCSKTTVSRVCTLETLYKKRIWKTYGVKLIINKVYTNDIILNKISIY